MMVAAESKLPNNLPYSLICVGGAGEMLKKRWHRRSAAQPAVP